MNFLGCRVACLMILAYMKLSHLKYYLQKKTHQDIIRFDVCMDEVALLHESEREEQLLRVALDGLQMESHIVAVLL